MKSTLIAVIATALLTTTPALAQPKKLVYAKDGSGVPGYKHTPIQPWSGFHVHDADRPAPPVVEAEAGSAPSDAIVLFDGKDLNAWKDAGWTVEDGTMIATGSLLLSNQQFGDCQLHLEWMAPMEDEENRMNQGNNGVQLLGGVEVQIFDSKRVKLYPDGQAAAIYAQTPPLVNACREPGKWQTFDIIVQAPRFDDAGKLAVPARITMLHNGILVHLNQEIYGNSPHLRLASYDSVQPEGPIGLMAHHCPVRFRNIWVRPLKLEVKQ